MLVVVLLLTLLNDTHGVYRDRKHAADSERQGLRIASLQQLLSNQETEHSVKMMGLSNQVVGLSNQYVKLSNQNVKLSDQNGGLSNQVAELSAKNDESARREELLLANLDQLHLLCHRQGGDVLTAMREVQLSKSQEQALREALANEKRKLDVAYFLVRQGADRNQILASQKRDLENLAQEAVDCIRKLEASSWQNEEEARQLEQQFSELVRFYAAVIEREVASRAPRTIASNSPPSTPTSPTTKPPRPGSLQGAPADSDEIGH